MCLISQIVHPNIKSTAGNALKRRAARGIVLRGESFLLLYTER